MERKPVLQKKSKIVEMTWTSLHLAADPQPCARGNKGYSLARIQFLSKKYGTHVLHYDVTAMNK